MDVESLAKQLILQNMTPEQQQAVLESVRATLQEARGKQKQRVSENVGMVVDALRKIEADIRAKYDDLGNKITARVNSIRDGRDGVNGSDGRDGQDGRPGRDGAPGPAGPAGRDGSNGIDGKDGVSVTDAKIDFDGSLIISLSNGREINVGEVVAPDLAEKIKVITNGGGTSQYVLDTLASLQTQINNLIPSQTGNAGKFLTTNGSVLSWASVAGGLSYQGTWNASTNTPTLASGVGTNGYYYVVATAGSTNLDGITDWQIGDWLLFNGTAWQKIDQSELVTSVASADASVTVTTTGSAVDLAVYSSPRLIMQVRNETGSTLAKGTVVYINGASGNKATVTKALATGDTTSAQTLGLIAADISTNNNGFVILVGEIAGLDTSAFAAGTQLYLSSTTAGAYTSTKQYAPNHLVYVGVVTRSHANQGTIEVRIQNGYEMDELHNVSAQSPSNGQVLIYNATTSLWEKNTLTAGTGISVTNGAGSITVTNSSPDQTVALTGAGTTSISGTYPNFTITSNDQYTGTVTSVGGTGTVNGISLSGTVTSSGNLTLGGTLSNVSLATQVTDTLPIANGGTGQTTANAAFNALAPSQTGNSGKYLTTNGTNTSWATISSTGTVTSVAATVPSFLSVSGSPITTSGTLAISYSGTALPVANGGTGITSFGSGVATWLGTPSSANLAAAVTDETGSGALVFGTSPTLTTPNINSAQIATVSGSAPLYMCRAWVNFNGTGTVAIRGSGNVSSITDNGTGDYTVNFTTAMSDANYAANVTGNVDATGNYGYSMAAPYNASPTTSAIRLAVSNPAVRVDAAFMFVSIFR